MPALEIRYCSDIGMWAIDRPIFDLAEEKIKGSCVWASDFCFSSCFNLKLYKLYPNMRSKDVRNERQWATLKRIPQLLRATLARKRRSSKRFRFMTRGEAFATADDVHAVAAICSDSPDRWFWIPTKAWRDSRLRILIEREIVTLPNVAVLASTDPDTSSRQWAMLKRRGWSTMYYGDNTQTTTPNGDQSFVCPKTYKGIKGHCADCRAGCFAPITLQRRVDVILQQH